MKTCKNGKCKNVLENTRKQYCEECRQARRAVTYRKKNKKKQYADFDMSKDDYLLELVIEHLIELYESGNVPAHVSANIYVNRLRNPAAVKAEAGKHFRGLAERIIDMLDSDSQKVAVLDTILEYSNEMGL